jgi:hypothetical protein
MKGMILNDPVIPIHWGAEQKGMQSSDIEVLGLTTCEMIWLKARDDAIKHADELFKLGLHKSLINRILEPWMSITIVVSGTEWENLFELRVHPDAERHFQKIAGMMKQSIAESEPQKLSEGEWHLPYITKDERENIDAWMTDLHLPFSRIQALKEASVGRACRVSYLTHDGKRDMIEDIKLCEKLMIAKPSHLSPFEHIATPADIGHRSGNFIGFKQFRKEIVDSEVR